MKKIVAIVALTLLSGCSWSRARTNDSSVVDRVRLIKPGVTKAEQLVKILGAQPSMMTPGKDDIALFGYKFDDKKTQGLMLVALNFSRTTMVSDTLYVEVDMNTGIVRNVYPPKKHDIEWSFWPFGDE